MLNKKISYDENVAKLSLLATLLYSWIIPHLDVKGRTYGNPDIVKGFVPYIKELTPIKIAICLKEMVDAGLILWYGNEHKYLEFIGFTKNQNLNEDKEAPSVIPAPELIQSNSSVTPAKEKISKEKISKDIYGESVRDFFNYFLLKTKKAFKLNPVRLALIEARLKDYTLEQLKLAVDNFVLDDWADRQKHLDLVYCIGIRDKIDNLEKWLNAKPKVVDPNAQYKR